MQFVPLRPVGTGGDGSLIITMAIRLLNRSLVTAPCVVRRPLEAHLPVVPAVTLSSHSTPSAMAPQRTRRSPAAAAATALIAVAAAAATHHPAAAEKQPTLPGQPAAGVYILAVAPTTGSGCPPSFGLGATTVDTVRGVGTMRSSAAAVGLMPCTGEAVLVFARPDAAAANATLDALIGPPPPARRVVPPAPAAGSTPPPAPTASPPPRPSVLVGIVGVGTWCGFRAGALRGTATTLSAAEAAAAPFSGAGWAEGETTLTLSARGRPCVYRNAAAAAAAATPTSTPSTSPTPAPNGGGATDACFPRHATVAVRGVGRVRMDALAVGNVVRVGPTAWSPIVAWSHAEPSALTTYVRMTTASAVLVATPGHYVYIFEPPVSGGGGGMYGGTPRTAPRRRLVAAGAVAIGDYVHVVDGPAAATAPSSNGSRLEAVTATATVTEAAGRYAPHTTAGELLVDGVAVSAYTTAVAPMVAHGLLAPVRWAAAVGVRDVVGERLARGLHSGGMATAMRWLLPRGSMTY